MNDSSKSTSLTGSNPVILVEVLSRIQKNYVRVIRDTFSYYQTVVFYRLQVEDDRNLAWAFFSKEILRGQRKSPPTDNLRF